MTDPDSLEARISPECPPEVAAILRAAWDHDKAALKPLLNGPGKASSRDPVTGETPLHAAIRAAVPALVGANGAGATEQSSEAEQKNAQDSAAAATVQQLLFAGAIWNDVDDHNETPGCVAWRRGCPALYEMCVSAGVRAEMLFAILDGYEALSSGDEEDEEGEGEEGEGEEGEGEEGAKEEGEKKETKNDENAKETVNGTAEAEDTPYLESQLTLADGKLVDSAGNGVMMAWEADIMRRSVDALLGPPGSDAGLGKRVLNIGFGLGIIDSMLAARQPARHHIIEAHPDVLARIDHASSSSPGNGDNGLAENDHAAEFGAAWESRGSAPGAHKIFRGRWQDVMPTLIAQGELYDAIYFDTFGEDYAQLHTFFSEYVPGLLDDGGVFGFFHGLGADRRICYDVYTRVVEMHLSEAGLDVAWNDVDVPLEAGGLDQPGKGAWQGIIRPYWTLSKYRLPVCTFMG